MTAPDPVSLARDLLRCPSVTPAEGGALALLQTVLEGAGFTVHRMTFSEAGTPDIENLYARIGTEAPHLMFAGHTDVVPPGNPANWSHAPFSGDIENDVLYGRGAVDMKGAIACKIAAVLDHLAANGGKPRKDGAGSISFLITGDEESVAINGTVKLLQWAKERGERFDHCILGEPGNVETLGDTVKLGRRGSQNGVLVITGRQGHVAYPHRADNPVRGLVRLMTALMDEPLDQGSERFDPVEPGVHLHRHRQSDGEPHSRRGARALQHPVQRLPQLRFSARARGEPRRENRWRQGALAHRMGAVERRRVLYDARTLH